MNLVLLQLHHAHDSFLVLTTDGINFIVNSQEICDFVNQCHDPTEAAQAVTEQVIQPSFCYRSPLGKGGWGGREGQNQVQVLVQPGGATTD